MRSEEVGTHLRVVIWTYCVHMCSEMSIRCDLNVRRGKVPPVWKADAWGGMVLSELLRNLLKPAIGAKGQTSIRVRRTCISCPSLGCSPFVPNSSWCRSPSFLAPPWGDRTVRRGAIPGSSHSTAGGPQGRCQESGLVSQWHCDFRDWSRAQVTRILGGHLHTLCKDRQARRVERRVA